MTKDDRDFLERSARPFPKDLGCPDRATRDALERAARLALEADDRRIDAPDYIDCPDCRFWRGSETRTELKALPATESTPAREAATFVYRDCRRVCPGRRTIGPDATYTWERTESRDGCGEGARRTP